MAQAPTVTRARAASPVRSVTTGGRNTSGRRRTTEHSAHGLDSVGTRPPRRRSRSRTRSIAQMIGERADPRRPPVGDKQRRHHFCLRPSSVCGRRFASCTAFSNSRISSGVSFPESTSCARSGCARPPKKLRMYPCCATAHDYTPRLEKSIQFVVLSLDQFERRGVLGCSSPSGPRSRTGGRCRQKPGGQWRWYGTAGWS
jgi:hypothetical protein